MKYKGKTVLWNGEVGTIVARDSDQVKIRYKDGNYKLDLNTLKKCKTNKADYSFTDPIVEASKKMTAVYKGANSIVPYNAVYQGSRPLKLKTLDGQTLFVIKRTKSRIEARGVGRGRPRILDISEVRKTGKAVLHQIVA